MGKVKGPWKEGGFYFMAPKGFFECGNRLCFHTTLNLIQIQIFFFRESKIRRNKYEMVLSFSILIVFFQKQLFMNIFCIFVLFIFFSFISGKKMWESLVAEYLVIFRTVSTIRVLSKP